MLLTQSIYSQTTINKDSSNVYFGKDTIACKPITLASGYYVAKLQKNENISFGKLGIGDPIKMGTYVFGDSLRLISYSTVYTKYLRVTGNMTNREYTYEEGTFFFVHDIKNDLFTVQLDGKSYLNFHANLFGKREEKSIYMVNPNTFVQYNEEYLKFESDDEDTLIYFYK